MLVSLLFLVLCVCLIPAGAITCRDNDNEWQSCDYCHVYEDRTSKDVAVDCLNGSLYANLNNYCFSDYRSSSCICSTETCTEQVTLLNATSDTLYCWEKDDIVSEHLKRNSSVCTTFMVGDSIVGTAPWRPSFDQIEGLIRPQSCIRMQDNRREHYDIICTCDLSGTCSATLAKEQRLFSEKVKCQMHNDTWSSGIQENETCTGDFCFIEKTGGGDRDNGTILGRGCITNNETLYPGLIKVGTMRTTDWREPIDYLVCNTSWCNSDWETAHSSVQATASSADQSALFEIEYRKLFASIKSAVDSFISRFAELYG